MEERLERASFILSLIDRTYKVIAIFVSAVIFTVANSFYTYSGYEQAVQAKQKIDTYIIKADKRDDALLDSMRAYNQLSLQRLHAIEEKQGMILDAIDYLAKQDDTRIYIP